MPDTQIKPVAEITDREKQQMLSLMKRYYHNVDYRQFFIDLNSKNWVIMLLRGDHICGFSTQVLNPVSIEMPHVNILFSGDTIVKESERNSMALPIAWGHMMLDILHEHPDQDLYWILTSKGYKTYRFLPTFFKEYYPRPDTVPPLLFRNIICDFAQKKYGNQFDPETWVVHACESDQRLREGAANITEARRKNKDISFFEKQNPGHASGNELVCVVRFDEKNLKPFILHRLTQTGIPV